MNSRERVLAALDHREPDRAPVDFWCTSEITKKLLKHFGCAGQGELLDVLGVDLVYIDGPRYVGPEPETHPDGAVDDHWGVPRVPVQVGAGDRTGAYREVINFPLEKALSVAEIHDYPKWPRIEWFDFSCVAEQVRKARATGKAVVFMGDRMNRCAQLKPAMYLRGVEQILLDLVLNPDIAEYLFNRIAEFYIEYARRMFEAAGDGIDIFMMGDDFGTQNGLFMSPDMFRRFLRPGFKAMIDVGKRHGLKVAHHSCGSIKPIIPDLIECGLDILNPIQPDVFDMDRRELKRSFGDRLSFHGSISIQKTLPFGTPEDIRAEVKERFETLGPGGGFIFCTAHNIQSDTPLENALALFEAYHEFGSY
ncbi:MAG TPA: uroporphyrinogen decarboxylase family protein [Candidatus Brocadiia bacterium]|nr:uroporphyrinogen decarboxylase family protein [Candidatus Brocadiia bacterium]